MFSCHTVQFARCRHGSSVDVQSVYLAACVIVSAKLSMQICHYFIMFLLRTDILTLITYLIYKTTQDFLVFHLFDLILLAALSVFENISH